MKCGAGKADLFATPGSAPQNPLGRAVGCLNENQNFRPTCLSKNLKKLLLNSTN